jgi:lipopolysaccharide/colanic/teichoic acid biosynthesis glycosyltransferase
MRSVNQGRRTDVTVPFTDFLHSAPAISVAPLYEKIGKRALDLTLVLATLPVALPVLALLLTATWFEGGRPIYVQRRIGRRGREFRFWKIRTMVPDADVALRDLLARDAAAAQEWHQHQKLKRDPRVTRLGRFLRRTSLDELPQILNVLNGTMSLVGPRPFTPEQQQLYAGGHAAAYYSLRPGLTGLWQVSRRHEGAFGERAMFDASYRAGLSLGQDLVILWRTLGVVFKAKGV